VIGVVVQSLLDDEEFQIEENALAFVESIVYD
jgi:hypothetical protein